MQEQCCLFCLLIAVFQASEPSVESDVDLMNKQMFRVCLITLS